MQQPPLLGGRQHGNGVGRTGRAQVGPFERIHGDVDLVEDPAAAVLLLRQADFFANVEHGRFIALALTDHNGAVDGHRVHLAAHRLDRNLVGAMAIALSHGVGAGDGGLFGDAKELEREVRFHGCVLRLRANSKSYQIYGARRTVTAAPRDSPKCAAASPAFTAISR